MQLNLLDAIVSQGRTIAFKQMLQRLYCISRNAKKTSHRTSFMPYVPLIPVGKIVRTWIWSFSCAVSMKNVLKFVWLFSGIAWLYIQMSI
jgi:hypothetical protein